MNPPDAYCFTRDFAPSGPAPFRVGRHYLLYARSGTLRLEAEGLRWTLPPARAALIAADHPITIAILTQLTTASVLFAPDFMPAPRQAVTVFDLSPLARALIGECLAFGPDDEPTAYGLTLFRTLCAVVLKLAETPSPFVLPVPSSVQLQRALDLTEAQAAEDPTFAGIARDTGQSPRALARRFADEMGMTWQQALRRIRLMQAVERLATTPLPVTDIAMSVGYNSLSAFNAGFRELVGMSPTQYRATFQSS
ncbi:AraC family transcriptional regulator [Asticcacaulis solisilvae]|uniref:AraC family transcriptional regulator n=1 Tax=Asticcacaulis solisilvae TaxID=1217274 RepID=UPI003FD806FD